MDDLDDVLAAFLDESVEGLDRLERAFVDLDALGGDLSALPAVFRVVHSIKGMAGILGLDAASDLAHAGESLVEALGACAVPPTPSRTAALFDLVDALRERLAAGGPGTGDAELCERLRRLSALEPGEVAPPRAAPGAVTWGEDGVELRVDTRTLGRLEALVEALAEAQHAVVRAARDLRDPRLPQAIPRLCRVTAGIRDGVARTRFTTAGAAWTRLPRVVRDTCAAAGVQARLRLDGERVGVDREVAEALREPLAVLVGVAVAHEIGEPEERVARGQEPVGAVAVRAWHEGGDLRVTVEADARGQPILSVSAARAVEGARREIERLGGSLVEVAGAATGVRRTIRVPLGSAVAPMLRVRAGGGRYAIPQADLAAVVRPERERAAGRLREAPGGWASWERDGEELPVVWLTEALGGRSTRAPTVLLALAEAGFALLVEEVGELTEAALRPLPAVVRDLRLYRGAAVDDDGGISLVLDVNGLAARVGLGGRAPGASGVHWGRTLDRASPPRLDDGSGTVGGPGRS